MKHLKKLVSLLLTAVMVLAMCIPVMADDTAATYTITIANAAEGHTYEAYQIFTGELSENKSGLQVLSNIDWGTGVTPAGKNALGSAKDKAAKLKNENDATQFAKEVAVYLSETKKESVPAADEICAAVSFVAIPPVPTLLPEVPFPMFSSSSSRLSTTSMNFASGFVFGSSVKSPSISDKRISRSACTRAATTADKVSLSPNFSRF